jgi:hypothetical protein
MKRTLSLILAGTLSLILAGWALSQVPASLVKSGIIIGKSAAQSSSFNLVEEHTASNSANLPFTTGITATYDDYQLRCLNLVPASNGDSLFFQMSTNGGSSYDSSAIYDLIYFNEPPGTGGENTSQTGMGWVGNVSTNGNYGVVGSWRFIAPLSTSLYKYVSAENLTVFSSSTSALANGFYTGIYRNTAAVNAFQVYFQSGNITSGTCRLYGYSH